MAKSTKQIKHMADLLKSGAILLSEQCPQCGSPLFKIHDKVWCSKCDKRVVIIKEGMELADTTASLILLEIEETVLTKLQENARWIRTEDDTARLRELGTLLSIWLEALGRIRKLRKA